jgi:hypothetical protein
VVLVGGLLLIEGQGAADERDVLLGLGREHLENLRVDPRLRLGGRRGLRHLGDRDRQLFGGGGQFPLRRVVEGDLDLARLLQVCGRRVPRRLRGCVRFGGGHFQIEDRVREVEGRGGGRAAGREHAAGEERVAGRGEFAERVGVRGVGEFGWVEFEVVADRFDGDEEEFAGGPVRRLVRQRRGARREVRERFEAEGRGGGRDRPQVLAGGGERVAAGRVEQAGADRGGPHGATPSRSSRGARGRGARSSRVVPGCRAASSSFKFRVQGSKLAARHARNSKLLTSGGCVSAVPLASPARGRARRHHGCESIRGPVTRRRGGRR